LYTDEDLLNLQNILALKFLGLSLEEIKVCLRTEPKQLQETLSMQKAMMKEKRDQLDAIIQAIDEAEKLLQTNRGDWESIVRVIQVIQMEQNKDWVNKYLSAEQQKKLAEWGKGWSEEDQKRANEQWAAVWAETKRLVAEGKDPASPEAQALAKQQCDLVGQFTRGDAGIATGLSSWWKNYDKLPAEEKPVLIPLSKEESDFLKQAVAIYQQG
jgi:DNA-binding transcriptional MerR regulator